MAGLFNISNEFEELFESYDDLAEWADDNGISLENAETAWFDTLDGIEQEFEVKAENLALYIKELNFKAIALKQEEKSLSERRKSIEHRVESIKSYLSDCMNQVHRKKIDGVKASISVRNNAPSLKIQDENALISMLERNGRDDLLRFKAPELNKTEIKNLLKSGVQLDGCSLVSTQSLIIK